MSDAVNPYQGPEMSAVPVKPLVSHGNLTENMLKYLKGASPWLRFVGVLGFISAGTTALSGLVFFVLVPLLGGAMDYIPGFEAFSDFGAVFGAMMGVLFIGLAVLIFFPSLFLFKFGEKIHSYLRTGKDQELEDAFKNNKSFWKFCGIIYIIYLAFIPLVFFIAVIAGVASALL
jgi:hypothetical protein